MDCFVAEFIIGPADAGTRWLLAMTGMVRIQFFKQREDVSPHSRHAVRPRFASTSALLRKRGRRESRVRAAPAVSCAICARETHTSIQVQRRQSGFPCAMVLRFPS